MSSTEDFSTKIFKIAEVARTSGGLSAYRYIGDQRRLNPGYLKYLGPAFGTKFTYFATKASRQPTAPVLDSVVQLWFERNVRGARLELDWSRPESYYRYLVYLSHRAEELSRRLGYFLDQDDVEYLIYRSGVPADRDSQALQSRSHLEAAGDR